MFETVTTLLDWLGVVVFAVTGALVASRKGRPAVQAFLDALQSQDVRAALEQAGFRPA